LNKGSSGCPFFFGGGVVRVPIFDGHNDVLLRLWLKKSAFAHQDFLNGDGLGHLDLPRLRAGGMAGGLFAVFSPPNSESDDDDDMNPPLAGAISQAWATETLTAMQDILRNITTHSNGAVRLCLSVSDIRGAMANEATAVVFHIEGAEAIGPDLEGLQALYDMGLRSLGPVWSRPNVFGEGVPFRFPSTPDTGNGLTAAGRRLVLECNRLGIAVDLSHLNEKGFWDVAKISAAPLIASHSNVHAVAPSSRNLTDAQIKAVGESGGIIGLNFAVIFLREDGRRDRNTNPETLLRHLDRLIALAGEDCVGLGSDFDGADVPNFIGDAGGLQHLVGAMEAHGYGASLIEKIAYRNWLSVLERTWGQ
jgi:membrane dipeptidase